MAIFKQRFSKEEVIRVLAFCVIPTHSWTIMNMLQDFPAWLISLNLWDLIGTVSYTLTSVLFEALVVFLVLMLLGFMIPKKWIGDRYVALSGLIIIETTIFAIIAHHYIRQAIARQLFPIIIIFLVCLVLTTVLVKEAPWINLLLSRITVPLTTLSIVFISVDLIGVFIILIRQL